MKVQIRKVPYFVKYFYCSQLFYSFRIIDTKFIQFDLQIANLDLLIRTLYILKAFYALPHHK